ncbi:MAG TPA: phage holin family protein [Solirubrobacteraceae bacterium]
MSSDPQGGRRPDNIAAAIADVSERASVLVREEIELAKAEVTEKATKLVKGAIVGVAAGVFFLTALFFVLIGCAWLLYFYLPVNDFAYFWGFFAMAVILIVLGVIAGLIAAKVVKRSAPPVPTMAIEEAHRIKAAVTAPSPAAGSSYGAQPASAPPPAQAAPAPFTPEPFTPEPAPFTPEPAPAPPPIVEEPLPAPPAPAPEPPAAAYEPQAPEAAGEPITDEHPTTPAPEGGGLAADAIFQKRSEGEGN